MTYQAIYKCRLCGEEILECETDKIEVAYNATNHLILAHNEINENYLKFGSMREQKMHKCKDGSIGIADFQGFKAVKV